VSTFTGPGPELEGALTTLGFVVAEASEQSRTVLDTFDGRLHAAGMRLELRRGPGPGLELVLTAADGGPAAHLAVDRAPRLGLDIPPGPLRSRVATVTVERALLPLLTVGSRRRLAERRDGRGKVTVVVAIHDRLSVDPAVGDAVLPELVAEVHERVGHPVPAARIRAELTDAGLSEHPEDLVGLLAGLCGVDLRGHEASPTVPLDPLEAAFDGYRRVLANLAATVECNLEGTIEDLDPEFLHELRVAVRRSRAVLRDARAVLPDEVRDRAGEDLRWMQQITGPARDLDVYVLGWAGYCEPLSPDVRAHLAPVLAHIERRRAAAHRRLARDLRSARFAEALGWWQAWLVEAQEPLAPGREPLGAVVAQRITKAQRRLLQHGRAIDAMSPAEQLHDLRKDAKRLRYLLECFGSLLDPKGRKEVVRNLKRLQDNLGEHQDTEVHVAELADLARELNGDSSAGADALLAMGRLTEQLEARRRAAREVFAQRFAEYDSKANRRALADLLEPLERGSNSRPKARAKTRVKAR
jgi:CHAD domain-containing protein